jgi:hypothetical protein
MYFVSMKKLLFTSILVFAFCFYAFAQTYEASSCPTISVIGPAEVPKPNEPLIFTATVSKEAEKYNPKYNWKVVNGEIIEGQGILQTKVLWKRMCEASLTVTFQVFGLPETCPNSDSETASVSCHSPAVRIDEFSLSASQTDNARLDNLVEELLKDPTAMAYIIEKFKRTTSATAIRRKIQKITDYLVKEKKVDKERFVISPYLTDQNLTQFWIVPAGTGPPEVEVNNQ